MASGTKATDEQRAAGKAVAPGWQFRVGVAIFAAGFAAPLAIPLVTSSDLPTAWKTVIAGALALGVPEIAMVVAAAVMGKEGFAELRRRLGGLLRRYGPPDRVGSTRYRIGLLMFTAPILLGWSGPYLQRYLAGFDTHAMGWYVAGDVVFVTSFFVLGGGFWEKLRALFVHKAWAVFPDKSDGEPGSRD